MTCILNLLHLRLIESHSLKSQPLKWEIRYLGGGNTGTEGGEGVMKGVEGRRSGITEQIETLNPQN